MICLFIGGGVIVVYVADPFGFSDYEKRRMLGAAVLIPLGIVFVSSAVINWVRNAGNAKAEG